MVYVVCPYIDGSVHTRNVLYTPVLVSIQGGVHTGLVCTSNAYVHQPVFYTWGQ